MRIIEETMFNEEYNKFVDIHDQKEVIKPTCEFNTVYEAVCEEGLVILNDGVSDAFSKLAAGVSQKVASSTLGSQFGMNRWDSPPTAQTVYSLMPRGNNVQIIEKFKNQMNKEYEAAYDKLTETRDPKTGEYDPSEVDNVERSLGITVGELFKYIEYASMIIEFRYRGDNGQPIQLKDFAMAQSGQQVYDYINQRGTSDGTGKPPSTRSLRDIGSMTKGMKIDYFKEHEFLKKNFKNIGLLCGTPQQFEATAKRCSIGKVAKGIKSVYDLVKMS